MKIALVGVGAVGGVIAARLLAAGTELTLLVDRAEQAQQLRSQGLTLRDNGGSATAPVRDVVVTAEMRHALPRDFDLILIATRSHTMPEVAEATALHLAPNGMLLLLQNGLPEEVAGLLLPRRRLLGGVVGWNAVRKDDHTVRLIRGGETVIGALPPGNPRAVSAVVQALRPLGGVRETDNLLGARWHKLAVNAVIHPLTAVGGLPLGRTLLRPKARLLALNVVREAIAVWKAQNVTEEPLSGTPPLARFAALPRAAQHLALLFLAIRTRSVRPSMLLDVEAERPTEIEALNAAIVRHAEDKEIAAPVNRALVARVRAIEEGAARPTPQAYAELAAQFDVNAPLT